MKALWLCIVLSVGGLHAAPYFQPRYQPPPMYFPPGERGTEHSASTFRFLAYPREGGRLAVNSHLYTETSGRTYIRLDEEAPGSKKLTEENMDRRFPHDFDSLFAYRIDPQTSDTIRIKADTTSKRWVFPTVRGKISTYSAQPGQDEITYMRLGDDTVQAFQADKFRLFLKTKPRASNLMSMRDGGKALSILMLVGGAGLALAGFLSSDTETTDNLGQTHHEWHGSPMIPIGFGMVVSSWIPYAFVKGNVLKAVKAFNQ